MVLLWHASAVALALITATSFAAIVSQKHPPPPTRASFRHPGLLHSAEDFTRVTTMVNAHAQPWYAGWQKLLSNGHAQSMYVPNPQPTVYRGSDGVHPQNYGVLYNDVAAAYQNALRWKISGNEDHAKAAIKILDAWSSTLLEVTGNSDRFLAYGFYGYQFANAAEIMRDYSGWPRASFQAFVDMVSRMMKHCVKCVLDPLMFSAYHIVQLQTKFQYWSYIFLYGDPTHASHNGQAIDHYWANWDLCNIALGLSLGVLSDNSTMYEQTIHYFKTGAGNGAIQKALWKLYDNVDGQTLAQYQESGRDQGHSLMGIGLLGVIAQIAYNQGDDLFSYLDSRILAG